MLLLLLRLQSSLRSSLDESDSACTRNPGDAFTAAAREDATKGREDAKTGAAAAGSASSISLCLLSLGG
jgi:hypothetical protein